MLHVMISAIDTSNALCKIHFAKKKPDAFTLAPTTEWHDRLSRIDGKIEKVPRGIQGKKSSKDMASSRNLVAIIGAQASPKKGQN